MYLLGRLVNPAGDLSHEGGAVFGLRQAAHQNHQDERARGIDNRRVVVDLGELSRLMSHSRSWRNTGGNGLVELLAGENVNHLTRRITVHRLAFGDGLKKDQ